MTTDRKGAYRAIKGKRRVEVEYLEVAKHQMFECSTDRANAVLSDSLTKISARHSWVNPLGIFLATFTVLVTTDKFKSFSDISSEEIRSCFIMASFISLLWLIYAVVNSIRYRNVTKETIIEALRGRK